MVYMCVIIIMSTCHYPEPPRNVTLKPLNSTSLLVDWISSSSFIIDSFGVSCHSSAGSVADEATTAGSNLEYEVNSLQPFSTYRCCVMATTTVGSTPMACQTAQTMEDSKYTLYELLWL